MLAALAEKKKLAAFMLHNPQHSFLAFVFPAFLSSDISRRPKPQNMTGFAVFLSDLLFTQIPVNCKYLCPCANTKAMSSQHDPAPRPPS